jgi:multidrug efflux pump subunit AcrB
LCLSKLEELETSSEENGKIGIRIIKNSRENLEQLRKNIEQELEKLQNNFPQE